MSAVSGSFLMRVLYDFMHVATLCLCVYIYIYIEVHTYTQAFRYSYRVLQGFCKKPIGFYKGLQCKTVLCAILLRLVRLLLLLRLCL